MKTIIFNSLGSCLLPDTVGSLEPLKSFESEKELSELPEKYFRQTVWKVSLKKGDWRQGGDYCDSPDGGIGSGSRNTKHQPLKGMWREVSAGNVDSVRDSG